MERFNLKNSQQNRHRLTFILVILIIILSLPLAVYLVQNRQTFRSKAAGGSVALSIQPETQTAALNQPSLFDVSINPNSASVSGVELYITYDGTKINITDIQPGSFFTSPQSQIGAPQVVVKTIDSAKGEIHYAIGFPLGSKYSSTTTGSVARVTFTPIAAGTAGITIDQTSLVSDSQANNVLGSVSGGTVVVTGGANITIALSPLPSVTPTSVPTIIPSYTPFPTPSVTDCTLKPKGDANCDQVINRPDFDIWLQEFIYRKSLFSDFNSDGKIDIIDLEIWRRNTASY